MKYANKATGNTAVANTAPCMAQYGRFGTRCKGCHVAVGEATSGAHAAAKAMLSSFATEEDRAEFCLEFYLEFCLEFCLFPKWAEKCTSNLS